MKQRTILIILCFMIFAFGCTQETTKQIISNTSDADSSESVTTFGVRLSGALATDAGLPAAGSVVEVESHPEYKTMADASGNFSIPSINPGTYNVYASISLSGNLSRGINTDIRAARFEDVLVSATEDTELPEKPLKVPGSISGMVALLNNPNNVELAGIDVYIPGTGFTAKTDDDGNFSLDNVPEGTYGSVRFDKSGLTSSNITDVEITSNADTDLGIVYMALSTGPSGRIVALAGEEQVTINGEVKNVLDATDVTVELLYDSRAVLMKISNESSFINAEWMPVENEYTISSADESAYVDYGTDGAKELYVKFADLNGLESSVYRYGFIIDTMPPVISAFVLMNGWSQVKADATGVYCDLRSSDTGTGVKEMMFANDASFTGGVWVPYDEKYMNLTLTDGTGSRTVYMRGRDYLDRVSDATSDSITAGDHTIINDEAHADNVILYKNHSPYQITSDVLFNNNLTIQAGVTIDHNAISPKKFIIKGRLNAAGTSGEPITLSSTLGNFGGFNVADSTADNNVISYLNVPDSVTINDYTSDVFITINGGTISNCTITPQSCIGGYIIKKTGYKQLLVQNNTITIDNGNLTACVYVTEGTGSTRIYDTVFTLYSMSFLSAVKQEGGTGTIVSYNTLRSSTGGTGDAMSIYNLTGNITVEYNDILPQLSHGTGTYMMTNYYSAYTFTLTHNNIGVADMTNTDHLRNNHSTGPYPLLTGSDNYFYGCGAVCGDENPKINSSGNTNITVTNSVMSGWPTIPGTDCVGHLCNE